MSLWQKKQKPVDYDRADVLYKKATEKLQRANARIDRCLAKMRSDSNDLNNMRKGPPGPDDSAGKARVCP